MSVARVKSPTDLCWTIQKQPPPSYPEILENPSWENFKCAPDLWLESSGQIFDIWLGN